MTSKLTGTQIAIVLYILRNTYGFHKEFNSVSVSDVASGIKRERTWVRKQLLKLEELSVILRAKKSGQTSNVRINTDVRSWKCEVIVLKDNSTVVAEHPTTGVVENPTTGVVENPTTGVVENPTTGVVENPTTGVVEHPTYKENIKKDIKKYYIYNIYGIRKNVSLTKEEFENLKNIFPKDYQERIDDFSIALDEKGYKYSNHYQALLGWNYIPKTNSVAVKKTAFNNFDSKRKMTEREKELLMKQVEAYGDELDKSIDEGEQ